MKSPPFRPVAGSSIRSPKEPRKPLKTLFGIAICLDMTWAELRPLNLLLFNRLRFVARLCLLAWVCQERMLEPSLINARSVQCQFCTVTVFSLQPCHMSYHVVANKCYTDISDVSLTASSFEIEIHDWLQQGIRPFVDGIIQNKAPSWAKASRKPCCSGQVPAI